MTQLDWASREISERRQNFQPDVPANNCFMKVYYRLICFILLISPPPLYHCQNSPCILSAGTTLFITVPAGWRRGFYGAWGHCLRNTEGVIALKQGSPPFPVCDSKQLAAEEGPPSSPGLDRMGAYFPAPRSPRCPWQARWETPLASHSFTAQTDAKFDGAPSLCDSLQCSQWVPPLTSALRLSDTCLLMMRWLQSCHSPHMLCSGHLTLSTSRPAVLSPTPASPRGLPLMPVVPLCGPTSSLVCG